MTTAPNRAPRGVALVTGAGSGIGRAAALALLDDGWYVVCSGRREATLRETAANHERASVVPADITDTASVAALFEGLQSTFGRLDVLFNNAGIGATNSTIDSVDLEQWSRVIATNVTGSFLCAARAFRMMKQQQPQGGRIINNGSLSAYTPRPGSSAYTASKHAITGLTKSIALDGRAFNIACGQIDVGNANTDLAQAVAVGAQQPDGSVHLEPTMDVRYVGKAIAFMASLPLDANVAQMTLMASTMPFVGRG